MESTINRSYSYECLRDQGVPIIPGIIREPQSLLNEPKDAKTFLNNP